MMEDNISSAESIIIKWDTESCARNLSLFASDHLESRLFLRSISDLQHAMLFFVSNPAPASSLALVRAQKLMQTAMRRLEREFHDILSHNRDSLDAESLTLSDTSSYEDNNNNNDSRASVAIDDLRAIAEAMVAAGYGRECVRVYKLLRRSIVDESLYRLGFEKLSPSHLQKLPWEVLDLKIRSWLAAAPIALRTIFSGERILCDHVFAGSDTIRESCFAEIARDAATGFLAFPESVAKLKRSPEKLFRILDLYDAIADLWQDVEAVFSSEAAAAVRSQALASLLKIAEAARGTLGEFEAAIQKDASKTIVPSGEIHPLTRYAMNYIVFLADYEAALDDIFADFPFEAPATLPDPLFDAAAPNSPSSLQGTPRGSSFAPRVAWLVLVLLCKMDSKAEAYREVALSYLFLANNLQYIVTKIRDSRLGQLLGDEWVSRHRAKVSHYTESYERFGWSKVAATIPGGVVPPPEAWERMSRFNVAFEEACATQAGWVVHHGKLKEEVRASVTSMIVPAYRLFYEQCREVLRDVNAEVVRFAPEDVRNRLADLFSGSTGSGTGSSIGSSR